MRKAVKFLVAALVASVGAVLPLVLNTGLATPAEAHDYKKGSLFINHPWARPTAETAQNAALYLDIRNSGTQPDTLVAVKTDLTATVEMHSTINENGVMKMRRLAEGIDIPANGSVTLEPGGLHVMLIGVKEPLKEGTRHPITLVFSKTGEVPAEIAVEKKPAKAGEDSHKHHH